MKTEEEAIIQHIKRLTWNERRIDQAVEKALRNDGNVSRVLRGEMPELAGAEEKAKAKMACKLIYKREATLNGNYPPKLYLGPLALLSLDTLSLNPPCYNEEKEWEREEGMITWKNQIYVPKD